MNPEIYGEIKRRILFLEYAPGQILNENVLAKEFGVSRTPMREVLYRLSWEELARIIPRTGTMVAEIEFQKMMHTYQTRLGIEGEVGRLCAELATETHLEKIRDLKQRCAALNEKKDTGALVDIDSHFRRVLHEAAGNPVLQSVSNQLYTLTFRLWYVTLDKGEWKEEVQEIIDEMEHTMAAIVARDAAKTARVRREALVKHFDRIRAKYLGVPSKVRL
ncbi:GntR family transcriptional regulator [Desulfosarcina ovata]|uniref:GntR family transcriptional regulator n=2 Tax=Desulfosarcina ovata TaxID=83564 RepID=A0A5K8AC16_9BACT|nr:GntR family transcriptional regulator [Desulfosarcina ovata]BBO83623.1 GntR family transcriptional regulator [Desulfosarcina ovata subsp. sediminis]BBO90081.1 GntR family transcriptional regulator [Desulfosarcina ovata subsp. ovata]